MNSFSKHDPKQLPPVLCWFLLAVGCVATALAIVGIFLPVLPTVPFLLLALACFARSSERFHTWLLNHSHLGPLFKPYLQGAGLSSAVKLKAIALVWLSITVSVLFFLEVLWLQVCLLIVAIGVSIHLLSMPTAEADDQGE